MPKTTTDFDHHDHDDDRNDHSPDAGAAETAEEHEPCRQAADAAAGDGSNTAAVGFRNLGQFVAAVNVSNNLGLDFTTLKTAMVTDGKSLGQAIQAQKGTTVNATEQAQRAERDADTMIRTTEKNGKKGTGHERP